ncbi:MAG: hypothetical protein LBU72_01160 [Burkholderiaceae bacterium]|jgi:hypothetical protein|nr:hypothetical protein [Burkholderiaceae bacterium]
MTVYIMGKAQPPKLSDKLGKAVSASVHHSQAMKLRRMGLGSIDARSYRRVMGMAEDLLMIAHAQAEHGLHPGAAAAELWLADVAAKCRARHLAAKNAFAQGLVGEFVQ